MGPNILLLLTDQERHRRWFPEAVRFPARERLADEGLTFDRHYIASPLCTPSRSNIFTGRHTSQTAMTTNIDFVGQGDLDPTMPTLGTCLRALGYTTAYVGKWHLGTPGGSLEQYGFADWRGPDPHGLPYEGRMRDGGIARGAADWLRAHADDESPWCLVVSFVNPHDIMFSPRFVRLGGNRHGAELPPNFRGDRGGRPTVHRLFAAANSLLVDGFIPAWNERRWRLMIDEYIDLTLEVDAHLGSVLDVLDETGRADDTLVVHTSDHGEMAGAHALRGKGPFLYEENLHVPLTVRLPGVTPAGSAIAALTSSIDLLPTLLSAAGGDASLAATAALGALPGHDLSPLLADPSLDGPRTACLFTFSAFAVPQRVGLHDCLLGAFDGTHKLGRYHSAGRSGDAVDTNTIESYDLGRDPAEQANLGVSIPGRVFDTLAELEATELQPA